MHSHECYAVPLYLSRHCPSGVHACNSTCGACSINVKEMVTVLEMHLRRRCNVSVCLDLCHSAGEHACDRYRLCSFSNAFMEKALWTDCREYTSKVDRLSIAYFDPDNMLLWRCILLSGFYIGCVNDQVPSCFIISEHNNQTKWMLVYIDWKPRCYY